MKARVRRLVGRRLLAAALWGVVAAFGQSSSAFAQARPPLDPNPNPPPRGWEQWRETVPVSGGLRVGIMAEPEPAPGPGSLTVWLPETEAAFLCVELSSQDGRYIASFAYDIRGQSAGPLALNLPRSEYGSQVRSIPRSQLAILARLASRCGTVPDTPGDFVVAGWRRSEIGDRIFVLLNSRLPTEVVAGDGRRIAQRYPCETLSGTTTAFNLRCTIPIGDMVSGRSFEIHMRRGDNVSRVALPLAVRR